MTDPRLSSHTISAWARSERPASISNDPWDSREFAADGLQLLASGKQPPLVTQEQVPDLGYAVRELALADTQLSAKNASEAFYFLSSLEWPQNVFSERSDILADIAYAVSLSWRRENDYPQMRLWEQRCITLLTETEPSATYLRNRRENGASGADCQFLARPAVLLAVCDQLEHDRNYNPRMASPQATTAFRLTQASEIPAEELSYLRGLLALSAAVSECHLGNFRACDQWLASARSLFELTAYPAALRVLVCTTDLMSKHAQHFWGDVLQEVDSVLQLAEKHGVAAQADTLKLVRAHTFKDVGQFEKAEHEFQLFAAKPPTNDPMMLAVNLVGLAECQHALGDLAGALASCRTASTLAEKSGAPLTWGMVFASIGQILRDCGETTDALRSFDRSTKAYAAGGLAQLESYMMIVTAEILLGLGEWQEGMSRLLGALAILKTTKVDNEIAVAIELLRAAAKSGLASTPQAVRELRQILSRLAR